MQIFPSLNSAAGHSARRDPEILYKRALAEWLD